MKMGITIVDALEYCAVNLTTGMVETFRAHTHFMIVDAELVVHDEVRVR
jgi:hypothetical protein